MTLFKTSFALINLYRKLNFRLNKCIASLGLHQDIFEGPSPELCAIENINIPPHSPSQSIWHPSKDDGIFLAVPKKRKTIQKRTQKRFGRLAHMWPLIPLQTCTGCGQPKEPRKLCPTCYNEIKDVTKKMQEAMIKTHGLNPVENESLVIFKEEVVDAVDGHYKGMRVVEVDHKRPSWFSQKLVQNTNVTSSSSTSVAIEPDVIHGNVK